ncbi:hypothetical protein [Blastomonas aquatica]|uniref:hypothetical protein n=1 Tax=Blastomonas aquatica TaxID=1510276 RepID=UPI00361CC396
MPTFKPRSKSFRKGFLDGWAAHYCYFAPHSFARAQMIKPSIRAAWLSVGDALRDAEKSEREDIGKNSRKSTEERVSA